MSASGPEAVVTAVQSHAVHEIDRPRRTAGQVAKDIVLFFAAPFVTLAYVGLFPFIAFRMVVKALREHKAST